MKQKKITVILLIFVFLFQMLPTPIVEAAQSLTIEQARTLAQQKSEGLQDVKIDRIKKQIELKQAQDGIKDIRKKESTVRFSLLFNIKFPTSHAMPKEIELIMKVPQIQNEITILQAQESFEALKSQTEAENAFYDVVQEQYNQAYLQERIQDSKTVLQKITKEYQTGNGKKEDVDYVQNELQNFENEYQKSVLNMDTKTKKLSSLLGINVQTGYTFTEYFPEVAIDRTQLEQITQFAKENDFEVFKKTQQRKLAETDTSEILGIYKSKYSKYIGDIESYIKAHENTKIDYDEFIQKYNYTLTQIDSPWAGAYVINLLFFKIRIPKEWFKGEYSGTRYMEDQKYALFVSLTERDKARKAEQNAITSLENTIYMAYSNLKQMESAYENAQQNLQLSEKNYNEQKKQNQLGLVAFSALESSRMDYFTKQKALFDMKIEYAKALSSFNLTASGYINHLLEGGSFKSKSLEAGDTFLESPQWYVKNDLTSYTFAFGVTIPQEYGVDSYQLYYDGMPVGDKLSLDEQLIHMPLTYSDSSLLEVRFFQNDVLSYIASFDGSQYSGELELKKADELLIEDSKKQPDSNNLGKWTVSQTDNLRSTFSIETSDLLYTDYELVFNANSVGKAKKGESVSTLSLYFSDMNSILIRFYNQGQIVGAGRLEGNNSGIIYKVE